MAEPLLGLVVRAQSGFFTVALGSGERLTAKLRGKLKKERRRSELAVVGDRVRVERVSASEGVIEEVLERRSWIVRREPGPRGKHFDDLVAANVELLLVVSAATSPSLQPGLVDRFLVAAALGHVESALVVTKLDLLDPASEEARELAALIAVYRRLGVPVIETSAHDGRGLDGLRALVHGKIAAVMGKSGAGKSSLLNALEPRLALEVGALSAANKKGLHTTRVASLHPFEGGFLLDTPGLRELGLPALSPASLTTLFPELAALGICQFTDCRHEGEPGCVVQRAIAGGALERGAIAPSRLESFRRLLADAAED